jgi:diguanylate cyclase (GGDEF)-like protein
MSQVSSILLALLVISLLLIGRAWMAASRARSRVSELEETNQRLRQDNDKRAELEQGRRLVRVFLREFPLFMRDLHGKKLVREIPDSIIGFVERIFEPRGAVVLMRRKSARSDPNKKHQLIAAASTGAGLRPGAVLRPGAGILERAFRAGVTLESRELAAIELSQDARDDFRADLATPMWIDGEMLGVVALAQPTRNVQDAKYLLELIAQTGAMALNNTRALNQIRSAADVDALTGILNKGAMTYHLERAVENAIEEESTLSIFLFDIDNFKNYNDVNGHVAGDELLRLLPALVAENLREDDSFGRYGGEEFLLIMRQRAPQEALHVAEKTRMLIEAQDFPFGDRQPLGRITVSGGVAAVPDHARSAVDLLRAADAALYEAKQSGRNKVLRAQDSRSNYHPQIPAPLDTRESDDLRQIRGIGPAFERAFHELGIVTFAQIADMNWQQMNSVAAHLNTRPERIVREGWLKQARRLHAERHGRDAPSDHAATA